MTRRDSFKTAAVGLLATFFRPARRPFDLMQFCDTMGRQHRYDLALPYTHNDWAYATDARVCVRVRPEAADVADHEGRMPPFESLSWNHAGLRGWRTLPDRPVIAAADSPCPDCDGTGNAGGVPSLECECEGFGGLACRHCGGSGDIRPPGVAACPGCNGMAYGVFPAFVELGGRYFDARLYAKAQRLGAEYVHDNWNCAAEFPMLKFRFAEGDGLLMGIRTGAAVRAIEEARGRG